MIVLAWVAAKPTWAAALVFGYSCKSAAHRMQSIQSPEREFQGFFSITGKRVPVILFQARRWDNLCTRHQNKKRSVRTKTSKLLWCSRWTRSLLWQLSLLELSMLRLNKSLCFPSVFSQCALSVCPTSVSYQCVLPGGTGFAFRLISDRSYVAGDVTENVRFPRTGQRNQSALL